MKGGDQFEIHPYQVSKKLLLSGVGNISDAHITRQVVKATALNSTFDHIGFPMYQAQEGKDETLFVFSEHLCN